MSAEAIGVPAMDPWTVANRWVLDREMERLRLRLHQRVLWLRQQWKHDPLQHYQGLAISEEQADWLLAGKPQDAEDRFSREDDQASRIGYALEELERAIATTRQEMIDAGRPPALDVLAALFGLTAFERQVVILCLAPELDPAFERLFAYVQDDVTRKYATPHLVLTLFASASPPASPDAGQKPGGARGGRETFLPEAPLRRFHLVDVEPGSSGTPFIVRPLRLDDRIANYLLGINRIDARVLPLLRRVPAAPLSRSHRDLVDRVQRWIDCTVRSGPWPAVNLIGPPGAGRQAVARAVCDRFRLQLYGLNTERLPAPGAERDDALRLLEREAVLSQLAFYLDATETDPGDRAAATQAEVIDHLGVLILAGSRDRLHADRRMLAVAVPKPDARAQRDLWDQALDGVTHTVNGPMDELVQQFDFGPWAIVQSVTAAADRARLRAPDVEAVLTADDLWQACRELAGWHLEELSQRIVPAYTWDDIVVPEDVLSQLREIASQVAHRAQVYETWGFGEKLPRGRGISALFSGPSGTGKTMAAEILANHLRLDLYRIDLSGVVSKYIGETEKNLRKVFEAAERSGAILFFDEADALFGKRTEVRDSHDRYANIEVNYLLQRMEDYRGLAILATNMKSALDPAFLRRLRFLVDFPFLDAEHRLCIWKGVFPPQAQVGDLDYAFLARLDISGGNIKNIALAAAFLAAAEGSLIEMPHVLRAVRREYAKIDKLIGQSEFGRYYAAVKR